MRDSDAHVRSVNGVASEVGCGSVSGRVSGGGLNYFLAFAASSSSIRFSSRPMRDCSVTVTGMI